MATTKRNKASELKQSAKNHGKRTVFLEGARFGRWTVLEYVGSSQHCCFYRCRCDCGVERILNRTTFAVDHNRQEINSQSCGCLRRDRDRKRRTKLEGQIIGRWTVVCYLGRLAKNHIGLYRCRCACGTERPVSHTSLGRRRDGRKAVSQSCGCLKRELAQQRKMVHGGTANRVRTPEYKAWRCMRQRCKNSVHYVRLGIKVCPEWQQSFGAFLAYIGPMPRPGLTVERPDGSKGYEPGNVKWATHAEQARNKSNVRRITFRGETRCLTEWAEVLGMTSAVHSRAAQIGHDGRGSLVYPDAAAGHARLCPVS